MKKKKSQKLPTGKVYVQQNGTQFYCTIPAFVVNTMGIVHHSIIEFIIHEDGIEIKNVSDIDGKV